jgi:hypothetical protein
VNRDTASVGGRGAQVQDRSTAQATIPNGRHARPQRGGGIVRSAQGEGNVGVRVHALKINLDGSFHIITGVLATKKVTRKRAHFHF